MEAVILDDTRRSVRFARPGVALDLGGIAKGHALDLAARELREAGVRCALLHGGTSTVVAMGAPAGAAGWRVAIRPPGPDVSRAAGGEDAIDGKDLPGPPLGHAAALPRMLRDEALSVSAPHGRTVRREGATHGHLIDPRRGAPAVRPASLAAVIAPEARLADAWSTALCVLGHRPAGMPRAIRSVVFSPRAPRAAPAPLEVP